MSGPRVGLHRQANFSRGYLDQISAIAKDAARQDDAGQWGLDGWIRLIHNLLDLQARTYASAVDIALAGPSWWLRPASTDPGPSEPVDVVARPYLRTFSIVKSFQQVGRKDIVIPDHAIAFVPDILAPEAKSFQIRLTDYNFVGADYTGTVRLRRADGPRKGTQNSELLTVTVGL